MSDIKGNMYRLKESRQDEDMLIGYTDTGKLIIPKNQESLHVGFAQVNSFTDEGNCYVAEMENVPYDFYYNYDKIS